MPDLAVANIGSSPPWDGSVSVLLGVGDGRFAAAVHYGAGYRPWSVAIGDPAGYALAFPDCDIMLGDMNGDGAVNGADIDVFFECLGAGGCP